MHRIRNAYRQQLERYLDSYCIEKNKVTQTDINEADGHMHNICYEMFSACMYTPERGGTNMSVHRGGGNYKHIRRREIFMMCIDTREGVEKRCL